MIVRSPYDDVDVPDVGLPEFLFGDLGDATDRVAIIDGPSGREVTFGELALGGTVTVPTLEKSVKVKIPAGTPNGRTLRVKGRGIARKSGVAGDLLVTVEVTVPKNLDAGAMSALRTYAQAGKDSGFDPRAGWSGAR